MLLGTCAYVKTNDSQTKWMYFLLKMMSYWKSIILFDRDSSDNRKRIDSKPA